MHQCHFTSYMLLYLLMCIAAVHFGVVEWMQEILTEDEQHSSKHRIAKRSLFEFRTIIQCYQPWADPVATYGSYGCWCGYMGSGRPLDDTDRCCYVHDMCYDRVDKRSSGKSSIAPPSYTTGYKFECANNRARCSKDVNSEVEQQLCECDRAAAECFTRSRFSYSNKLFFINAKRVCTGKDKDLVGLDTGRHILDRLYSCPMELGQDKCCVSKGYNSAYEMCCNGEVRLKGEGCGPPNNEKSLLELKLDDLLPGFA